MDWVALLADSATPPTAEQQAALIKRAKDFVSAVQGSVLEETKEWATEFQSNRAQMEKDLKSQLDDLKAKVDKADKEREAASRPGAIELTIENADKTDGFRVDIVLEGKPGKFLDSVMNSKVWTRINTPPEQYKLTINAKANGNPISTSTILEVKPAETVKPSVALPIP